MNKIVLITEDLKNIVSNLFEQDYEQVINIKDGNENEIKNIKDFLDIDFYAWKNRFVHINEGDYVSFEDWVTSLNVNMHKSFGLVELTDKSLVASPDVDSGVIYGKITFIAQTYKLSTLEYYLGMLASKLAGDPQEILDGQGNKFNAYLVIGQLLYEEQPDLSQFGETLICSCNFSITYMNEAQTYKSGMISASFDDVKYYDLPITEATKQAVFTGDTVIMQKRPDFSGRCNTAASSLSSLSFYDFNNDFSKQLNQIHYNAGAYKKNGTVTTTPSDVNPVIYIKIKDYLNETNNAPDTYVYKMTINNISKNILNSSFIVTTLNLQPYAKR